MRERRKPCGAEKIGAKRPMSDVRNPTVGLDLPHSPNCCLIPEMLTMLFQARELQVGRSHTHRRAPLTSHSRGVHRPHVSRTCRPATYSSPRVGRTTARLTPMLTPS